MRISRIAYVLALAAIVAGLPGAAPLHVRAAGGPAYNLMMNWFPEPEEGGFYEAQRLGLYQKAGISSTIEQFGFSVYPEQYVLSGRATFGMANADQILEWNAAGAKLVAVMTSFQTNPIGILWHAEDKTIHSLADLSNHTLIYTFGSPFEQYLVAKYHYTDFHTKNNDYTSRGFAVDPTAVHQCYVTSEPYLYSVQGLKVKYALVASTGFNPYGAVIFTTQDFANSHPAVVRAYVKASVAGWTSYLKDSAPTNAYLRTAPGAKNYPETPAAQTFSYTQMKKLELIDGGDAATHGIGWMGMQRWTTLQQQMVGVGFKVGGVDVGAAFTDRFLL